MSFQAILRRIESLAAQYQVEFQQKDSDAKEVLEETIRSKDIEIERLNGAAKNVELSTQLAVNKATEDTKAKLLKLETDLKLERSNHETAKAQIEASHGKDIQDLQHQLELKASRFSSHHEMEF